MKRANGLFAKIIDWENLRLAVAKSLRGKRHRSDARHFVSKLDSNLLQIRSELINGDFQFGIARQFSIFDPKPRLITAPRFEERVVHHAVMNICEPFLDRYLIADSYACRKGKGRERCLEQARRFSHLHRWFLKLDIRKYFDSINHGQLRVLLQRRFKERRLLGLFEQVISSFQVIQGRGLPIGSLISQHLANHYLADFDRFCQEVIKVPGYLRYMDDMILWSDSKQGLMAVLPNLEEFLASERSLTFKPSPFINRTSEGITFLGCRVFPTHVSLARRSRKRYQRRLLELDLMLSSEEISEIVYQQRATSLTAFTRAAGAKSWTFRSSLVYHSLNTG